MFEFLDELVKMSKERHVNNLTQSLKLHFYLTISFFIFCLSTQGQSDSSDWAQKPEVSYSGYLDIFYAYDFNEPKTNYRQPFLYSFNRHNEFNLNLGLISQNSISL